MGTAVFAPEPTCGFFLVQVTIRCPCLYSSMIDIVMGWAAEGRKSLLSSLVVEVFSTQIFLSSTGPRAHMEKNPSFSWPLALATPQGIGSRASAARPCSGAKSARAAAPLLPSQNVSRIFTLQACMKKFQVVSEKNTFVPSTGIFHVISLDHMKKINYNAIVRNSRHFDNETGGVWLGGLGVHAGRHHQASSGPFRLRRRSLFDRVCFGPKTQVGLHH